MQDPQWNPPQRFQQALPLWPEKLIPDWSNFYRTRYQVVGNPNASYYWGLSSKALGWERISVPAGQFNVLKYHNENPYVWSLTALPIYDGIARMKSQAHWQTDVLAGAALGATAGVLSSSRETPLSVLILPHSVTVGLHKIF